MRLRWLAFLFVLLTSAPAFAQTLAIGSGSGGGGGGSGTVTSVTIAGTANQITATGTCTITTTGTCTLAIPVNPTFTTPLITTGLKDANGNVILNFTPIASAVDGLTITNAATANPATVSLACTGSDANINCQILSKGTGVTCIGSCTGIPTGTLSLGTLSIFGATSGQVNQVAQGVAGTPTITWGTSTGTPAVTASSPLGIATQTGNITCTTCTVLAGLTTNTIPKAASSSTLANSALSDSGTVLTYGSGAFAYNEEFDPITANVTVHHPGAVSSTVAVLITTAQFDMTTTTLTNIPKLTYPVQNAHTYKFIATLYITASATGGTKYAVQCTCTVSAVIYQINLINNSTNANAINSTQTSLGGSAGVVSGTSDYATITGTLTTTATGNLTIQFAENTALTTSSVLVGSDLIVMDGT